MGFYFLEKSFPLLPFENLFFPDVLNAYAKRQNSFNGFTSWSKENK